MRNKELFDKLKIEGPLTAEEALVLDESLESDASEQVAQMVSAQHEDAPSLTWRSQLNQRLLKETRKGRKTVLWRVGAAVTTGALATTLLLAMINDPTNVGEPAPLDGLVQTTTSNPIEDTMLIEHEDFMNQSSLGLYASFEDGSGF